MAYTFSSPETVTKAAILITNLSVAFAGASSAATITYCDVDQNGGQISGSQASLTLTPADFVQLWNAGLTLSALYSFAANKLGLASGTSGGDGTLK